MTRKQWQSLIPAGMLSLALLAGVSHAEELNAKKDVGGSIVTPSSDSTTKKKSTKRKKSRKKKDAAPAQTPA